ncbi:MAG TPA: TauD/TfdA family dioxygenase, partial [Novosphingobium sp.]|nr:TauD/TfdA family dioxygenase [Novosphingobium sp.]
MTAIAWEPLEPFGARVDMDLSAPLSPAQEAALRALLDEQGLILARGQSLTMARQRSLCALFGPILDRAGEGGVMSNEAGGHAASALNWHSDAAYTPDPFDALSLHAIDVEPDASATLFVDARAGLARLPADLRAALEGRAQHMIAPHYTRLDRLT